MRYIIVTNSDKFVGLIIDHSSETPHRYLKFDVATKSVSPAGDLVRIVGCGDDATEQAMDQVFGAYERAKVADGVVSKVFHIP